MEEDRNPQIKVDWGINDIRILHDALECYTSTQIDYDKHHYEQATQYEAFVTHSEFRPYVTKVGLYNDFDELIAIGQLSAPIKNDKDLALGFVVRFDA